MQRFAVFGDPIDHSLSPDIHHAFAEQFSITLDYQKQRVTTEQLPLAIQQFFASDGAGLNITLPLKTLVVELLQQTSFRAQQAAAVNTIGRRDDGCLWGDNTDGIGFVQDVKHNLNASITGKTVLLLGAGGAAKGVVGPLLDEHPTALMIANRSPEKALDLAQQFRQSASQYAEVRAIGMQQLADFGPFDWLINATSASTHQQSMQGLRPLMTTQTICYDLAYSLMPTPFCQLATDCQAAAVRDGLGMLVEQAAQAFYLWHDKMPDSRPILELLQSKQLKAQRR